MHKVFLALGANVGNKKKNLKEAIKFLSEKIENIKVAQIYETKPWGFKEQGNFLNTALKGDTSLSPLQLLKFVKDIERKIGRIKRFKWGPREIDIDILFYDSLMFGNKILEIPHPRLHERDFVLKPMMDLDPNFIHPKLKKTIRKLYAELLKTELTII